MLPASFFDDDACSVAVRLLGKTLCRRFRDEILKIRIIETEAYYKADKASHASLGYTERRKALFMPSGTIYMYYSRGKPSLNFSAQGEGNAVLAKSGIACCAGAPLELMLENAARPDGSHRKTEKLCSGQTLVCTALGLKTCGFDKMQMSEDTVWFDEDGYAPEKIIVAERLGIPDGRDGQLPYRFIDCLYADRCTKNPLKSRKAVYRITTPDEYLKRD